MCTPTQHTAHRHAWPHPRNNAHRDLPGFYDTCARLLAPGGVLLMVQPLNFLSATMAMGGVGERLRLFQRRHFRFRDLEVGDEGSSGGEWPGGQ